MDKGKAPHGYEKEIITIKWLDKIEPIISIGFEEYCFDECHEKYHRYPVIHWQGCAT
ncbi:MAG TPA: hypothetical protein VFD03_06000 [Clostridia bacterium]|nr:hypothetical protein [Clostridia bacterium]